jgi:hypothetical protein
MTWALANLRLRHLSYNNDLSYAHDVIARLFDESTAEENCSTYGEEWKNTTMVALPLCRVQDVIEVSRRSLNPFNSI